MQNDLSCIRDSGHFLVKIEGVGKIPDSILLLTADVVDLYPNIPHKGGLSALKEALNKRTVQKNPTESLVQMTDFDLSNNCFEFNGRTLKQISRAAIGTKFAPTLCVHLYGLS